MRLIDAHKLEKEFKRIYNCDPANYQSLDWGTIKNTIRDQPKVDPVKHGEWEYYVTIGCIRVYTHTACGCVVKRKSLYCPLCGAKMTFEGKEVME